MTNQAQAKRQPLLILALVLALLPIFTLTSMSTSAATGPIDLLEGKLGIDFTINRDTKNEFNSSADKLFDGTTLDAVPAGSTSLTKYRPVEIDSDNVSEMDIQFDFGITSSRFAGVGATIRGVQLSTAADAPERDATGWTLEGSNDITTAWTLIHSEIGLTPPTDRDSDYEATMFPTSETFRFFRFRVTSTSGPFLDAQLSSLRFFGDPIVISNQEELMAIGTSAITLDRDYVLGNDIVLNDTELNSGYYIPSLRPGGGEPINFTGNFDGAGFTISGLKAPLFENIGNFDDPTNTSVSHLNLFTIDVGFTASGILAETLSNGGLVSDVHVSGTLIQPEEAGAGGLVGKGHGDSIIESSTADVTITATTTGDIGGLVGDAYGIIRDSFALAIINSACFSDGTICGGSWIGGLAGAAFGNIENSYAKVLITDTCSGEVCNGNNVGGLVGHSDQATIANSASWGRINGGIASSIIGGMVGFSAGGIVSKTSSSVDVVTETDSSVGGLVGRAQESTSVLNSFASGSVTNHGEKAGGLIGYIDLGTVSNCVATGDVSGYLRVGGLVGYSESTNIRRSSAQGHISGSKYVGGLIGQFATDTPSTVEFSMASGLVEYLDSPAAINFLITLDENAPGSIGGLIGRAEGQATLKNLSATGNVLVVAPEGVAVSRIGGLIGASISNVRQASASGDVTASGGVAIGGLIGYEENRLFHTFANGTVTGAAQVGLLVGLCDVGDCINKSRFGNGSSTASDDPSKNDVWEGSGNQTSNDLDEKGDEDLSDDGPTEPVAPPVLGVALLNSFDAPPDPLPWAQSASINGNRPHLLALLGTGFYIESAPTPSITPSTQSVSAVAKSAITPTTAFTPVNLTSPVYTVSPALPAGLEISPTTGVISGTPISASPSTSYVVTATSGAQSATATVTLVVTAAPSVAVVIPDPPQTSKIISATSEVNENSNGEEIIVLGDFNSPISNIAINGKAINSSDWKQEASKLVIKYVTNSSSKLSIQIWNGQAPVLSAIDVVINVKKVEPVAKPTEVPVATPVITPTPKPVVNTGVKKAVIKKKTIVCYKGKKSKKVKAVKPVCPKGYKVKK